MGPSARRAPTPSRSGSRGTAGGRGARGLPRAGLVAGLLALAAAPPLAAQGAKAAGASRGRPAPAAVTADSPFNALHAPGAVGRIAAGETVRGELAAGDQLMSDSTYADVWELSAAAGQHVDIDLRSDEFDTFLQVLDPSGAVVGQDDDSGGDLNSHLALTLPAAATYRIVVNSAGHERRVGYYTLSVR